MRTLIVAPSATPPNLKAEILEGVRPRLDYFELSNRLSAPYLDYDSPSIAYHDLIRSVEHGVRLDFYLARIIAKKIEENSYDFIITLSERMGIPLAYMLGTKVRHVTVSHKPLSPHKLHFIRIIRTFRRWNMLLTFSQAEADVLRKSYHLGEDRIRAFHWGVDTKFYKPLRELASDTQGDHIFSIGISNRDYPTLIQAMAKLPHIECHICPTSAWESHGFGYDKNKLPRNVRIVSHDHPLTIREAYSKSRFVVIPLQSDTTQWSAGCTSVLQPQAMGKAVIATHLPGIAEYLVNRETGLLVEGANPARMAQAIDELWRDPARTAAMGAQAREWVEANRSLEAMVERMAGIVNEIG